MTLTDVTQEDEDDARTFAAAFSTAFSPSFAAAACAAVTFFSA